jgi:arginyl-tRNA synthetase
MIVAERIRALIDDALARAKGAGLLEALESSQHYCGIVRPKNREFGDLSSSVALKIASGANMPPLALANLLASYIKSDTQVRGNTLIELSVMAPGFLNFKLGSRWLSESLQEIHRQEERFGKNDSGRGKKVTIENVNYSASPFASNYRNSLKNLFEMSGYEVCELSIGQDCDDIEIIRMPISKLKEAVSFFGICSEDIPNNCSDSGSAFYVRYAHARCCAALRLALEPRLNIEDRLFEAPLIGEAEFGENLSIYKQDGDVFEAAFSINSEIFAHQKELVLTLQSFPSEVREALAKRQPDSIARFSILIADDLQKYFDVSHVITDNTVTTRANLGLIIAAKQVLANALAVLGIPAPVIL